MCLAVYLGVDRTLSAHTDVAVGDVGLESDPKPRPKALARKARVYHVSDRAPTGWTCACVFLDHAMPWEAEKGDDPDDPETPARARAYPGLRRIARAALEVDSGPLIFSCWWGDQGKAPALTRDCVPDDIRPARYLLDDTLDGGSGGNPPILIRLREGHP